VVPFLLPSSASSFAGLVFLCTFLKRMFFAICSSKCKCRYLFI
jgi:hypothetical protein